MMFSALITFIDRSPYIDALSDHWFLWSQVIMIPLLVSLFFFPWFIRYLKSLNVKQFIREDGPESHHVKKGTPTGGGMFIIGVWALSANLFAYLFNMVNHPDYSALWRSPYFVLPMVVTLALMGLGMWDDLAKVMKKHNKGVGALPKLAYQALVGAILGVFMVMTLGDTHVNVFGNMITLPAWGYIAYASFSITALSNAVNLTDGLDGLAGSTTAITIATFILLLLTSTMGGMVVIPSLLLCGLLIPILLVFTGMFNKYPAKVFMGDSGSLALGGFIGAIGLLTHQDGWLLLTAGLFALEALSVVLQVASYKLTGTRLFRMAPIHHHFELTGLHESVVVDRFCIFHAILCTTAFCLQRFV